jgi:NADH dehydrogenase (ubiquinone) Fe-S protein 1
MWELNPALNAYDVVDVPSNPLVGLQQLAKSKPAQRKEGVQGAFKNPIENFYRTDPISRS